MNQSSIVRFNWYETFAFARARAATSPAQRNVALTAALAILLAITLVSVGFPESLRDVVVVAGIALGGACLVSYGLVPLVSRLPNNISVTADSFVIGRTVVPFANVAYGVVGTTRIGNREFPVLTFREHGGQTHLYGLSGKVEPHELAGFLERVGVREPQA